MKSLSARNRSGDVYKPTAIRGFKSILRDRINSRVRSLPTEQHPAIRTDRHARVPSDVRGPDGSPAGVNAKALSTYMGHSSVTITLDRYGHLFPGNEEDAAGLLRAYLDRSDTAARLAQIGEA